MCRFGSVTISSSDGRSEVASSRSPAAVPHAARVNVSVDYTSCAVRFRYGAGDAGSAPLDRNGALGRSSASHETIQRRLMKEKGTQ